MRLQRQAGNDWGEGEKRAIQRVRICRLAVSCQRRAANAAELAWETRPAIPYNSIGPPWVLCRRMSMSRYLVALFAVAAGVAQPVGLGPNSRRARQEEPFGEELQPGRHDPGRVPERLETMGPGPKTGSGGLCAPVPRTLRLAPGLLSQQRLAHGPPRSAAAARVRQGHRAGLPDLSRRLHRRPEPRRPGQLRPRYPGFLRGDDGRRGARAANFPSPSATSAAPTRRAAWQSTCSASASPT